MNRDHVKKAEDLVTTMWEVYQVGYVAECTFRIDAALIEEAMQELVKRRAQAPADQAPSCSALAASSTPRNWSPPSPWAST